jgi:hypothetical protein
MNQAVPRIKEALQSRLLFLGKYALAPGPPIHKSATCVVRKAFDEKAEVEYKELFEEYSGSAASITRKAFKETVMKLGMTLTDEYFDEKFASWDVDKSGAITCEEFIKFCALELDKGQKREVVFKFMKNEDQFKRELEARDNGGDSLDPRFIVGVTKSFEGDTFCAAVRAIEELAEYKCVRASEASAKEFLQQFSSAGSGRERSEAKRAKRSECKERCPSAAEAGC